MEQLLRELKNYFIKKVYRGTFSIRDGSLVIASLLEGQYFKIEGSVLNDGVYLYPADDLRDETFDGEVWALDIPREVQDLWADIEAWTRKYGSADSIAMSPYVSESFGGYSYTKGGNGSASGGASAIPSWRSAFASRLNPWRKARW